jgi:hypothetical protein
MFRHLKIAVALPIGNVTLLVAPNGSVQVRKRRLLTIVPPDRLKSATFSIDT